MWIVIITVVIISFVFWGSQSSRMDSSRGRVELGTINGEKVSINDYRDAQREVYLRYFLSSGEWPDQKAKGQGFDVDRETYFRLLLVQKQNQLGIHVGSEAVAKTAGDILRSINRGNTVPLDVFAKQVLQPKGMTVEDFERFIRHDLGIQQLVAVAGLGGNLVTPQEIRALYAREHEELSVQAVFFAASNYLASATPTPDAIGQFYTNQMARYRLPERLTVSYVAFPASNYLAAAQKELAAITNLNERIDAAYEQVGTNYFLEAKTPAEKKEKIRELMLNERAMVAARKAANEFATQLFTNEPVRVEHLATLAKANQLTVSVTAPFSREEPPLDLDVRANFTKAAFGLSADEPISPPITGEHATYVIALGKKLPSEVPPLDQIRAEVTRDYSSTEGMMAARKAGTEFYHTATNGLTTGKTFSALCSAANLRPVLPPPLSLSTRSLPDIESHVNLNLFKQAAYTTPPGKLSSFMPSSDGGFLVFVQSKLPLDETKLKADMPAFTRSLQQVRRNEAFNEWFRHEAERGLRDTPLGRPQQPQMTGTPKK
jgi:hypothetical protein